MHENSSRGQLFHPAYPLPPLHTVPSMLLFLSCFSHRHERNANRATYPAQPESCSSQHPCGDQDGGWLPKPRAGRDPKKALPQGRDVLRAERKVRVRKASLAPQRRELFCLFVCFILGFFFHSSKFYFTNFRSNFHKIVFWSITSLFLASQNGSTKRFVGHGEETPLRSIAFTHLPQGNRVGYLTVQQNKALIASVRADRQTRL